MDLPARAGRAGSDARSPPVREGCASRTCTSTTRTARRRCAASRSRRASASSRRSSARPAAGKTTLAYLVPRFLSPSCGPRLRRRRRRRAAHARSRCARRSPSCSRRPRCSTPRRGEPAPRAARRERCRVERAARSAGADDFMRRAARWLPDAARSRRRQALGRAEAAARDRAGAAARRRDPDPRRADLGPRPRHSTASGRFATGRQQDPRAWRSRTALHRAARRPDPLPARRPRSSSPAAATTTLMALEGGPTAALGGSQTLRARGFPASTPRHRAPTSDSPSTSTIWSISSLVTMNGGPRQITSGPGFVPPG